ncbi:MAG: sigma-70 family RNA polymerase sigma factor, partial [Solirubrobacterales bacterium]
MTPHISTTLLRTQTDERLVRLAAGGHERAFEAIVERYRRPLTRFAQRYVGEARAEEVVQTAFLNAWNSLRSGTDVHDLKPWLYRIVNNGAINALQRAEYSDAPLIEASDFRMGPEAAFEQSEELRLTVENIAGLPERQREALLAVAVDGRAHADVARELGVSDAGVRQLVRRARVQLRAAATAITPIPLAVWIAKGGLASGATAAGGTAAGSATAGGSAAAGTAAGGAAMGGALKMGAVVAGVATVAAGGSEVAKKVEERNSNAAPPVTMASAAPGERTLIPGADPAMAAVPGQPRVRMIEGPDGRQRVVVSDPAAPDTALMPAPQQPSFDGGPPRQVAGVFDPSMPVTAPGRGGRGGSGNRPGPREVAQAPAAPGGGFRPTGETRPGRDDSGSGANPGGGRGSETPSPSRPERPSETRPDRPSTAPTSPGTRPDRPSTAPAEPSRPDRPEKVDKPDRTDKPDNGGGGGSSKGDSGSSRPSAGDAPAPVRPDKPGKGGGRED